MTIGNTEKKLQTEKDYNEGWITDYPQIENLIILPCHSVYAPELNREISDLSNNDRFSKVLDANNWLMASFQKESEDQVSFVKHIEMSLLELHENIGDSVLVVTGGYTKPEIEKSESAGYIEVAKSVEFLKNPYFRIGTNILIEEYARDSYENVLYSICTFYKKFNKFPKKITVVGYGFKKERFVDSHLATLGYKDESGEHVKYVSVGPFYPDKPESMSESDYEEKKQLFWSSLRKSEKTNALDLFKLNPFGSKGSKLHEKKEVRDPWNKHVGVSKFYNDNVILNTLIEIDDLELNDAMRIYRTKIEPEFPLYK
ncbi:hypothetical protein CANINC_001951 [Pichia inconspicua]|uniref:DUF218 domain-containing protein n=1 Tax=Pichia inconspicua TaxID=52247 RepID=A0A4T0X2D9_9ASCO|nr:hypothetical protein CANINC_001951 [[Candida] inconspicua]